MKTKMSKVWRMIKWNTYLEFNKMNMRILIIQKGQVKHKVTYVMDGKKIRSEFIEGMWPHEIIKYAKKEMSKFQRKKAAIE